MARHVAALGSVLALGALSLVSPPVVEGEVVPHGNLRVSFSGKLAPTRLPRHGAAAVSVDLGGRVYTTDGSDPPGLEQIEIAVNRHARFDPSALPACRLDQIQPATTAYARRICGASRVGEGSFEASVAIPEQAPYPSQGAVTLFNGVEAGRPVLFLHVYGAEPLPTSFTLPLTMKRGSGQFGTVLAGRLPSVDSHVGFVTGISLRLDRTVRGRRAYLSAGCPAPKGFSRASFLLVRPSFTFAGGSTLAAGLIRSCAAG